MRPMPLEGPIHKHHPYYQMFSPPGPLVLRLILTIRLGRFTVLIAAILSESRCHAVTGLARPVAENGTAIITGLSNDISQAGQVYISSLLR